MCSFYVQLADRYVCDSSYVIASFITIVYLMAYALALGNPSIQTWSYFSKNNISKFICDSAHNFPIIEARFTVFPIN